MTSEIDKLKHFHAENYSDTNFTDDLNDGELANEINFDLLNTFFNHQHEMTRSSSINKTTMKNILNDGRDISIAKFVENTSLIIK